MKKFLIALGCIAFAGFTQADACTRVVYLNISMVN